MSTFESKYTIGEELGKGAYATVYRCTSKTSGQQHAVKIIDKSKAGPKDISDVLHEVNMMKSVAGHPGVVTLYEFFDTPAYMYLVLELVEGGMLFDRIVAMKHYSEASASVLIKNFLIILQHIHSKGIIHRDLKPENLLLKHAHSVSDASCLTDFCVADFGLAGVAPGQTCCGSPSYIAPEVINVGYLRTETTPYDTKADVWSVGVIAYILLSGKMPFHGRNFKETFAKIVKGQWAFVGDVWEGGVSPQSKDFIMKCLTMDPRARPSAAEALQHPWVVNVQSDMHLAKSIEAIRQFNAERKLRAAMLAFRTTTGFLGHIDKTPPFMKYLQPPVGADKYSTRINAQSQTHPDVVHQVDYSKALDRVKPGWNIRQCCTCGSAKVCRHIQNVYDYLFNGRVDMDVAPFVNELLAMREDAQFDLEDDPNNAHAKMQMAKVDAALTAARLFREEYCKVPAEEKKPNFFAMDKPSGAGVSKAASLFKRATA